MKPNITRESQSVQMFCSAITTPKIPRRAPATAMGIETLKLMKTRLTLLKLTILLFATFVTTAVFGQTLTWTNQTLGPITGNGRNIGVTTNWSGGSPLTGTVGTFDGTVPGPLVLTSSDGIDHDGGAGVGAIGGGFGANGFNIHLTSTQTSPVQIVSPSGNAVSAGFNLITIDAGAGQFTLGDNTANEIDFTARPAGALHDWINNSANPVIICPNVGWQAGGGSSYTLIFDGPGDWGITNNLACHNGTGMNVAMLGTGTVTWSGPSIGLAVPTGVIISPFTINEGTLILKTNNLLGNQSMVNNGVDPVQIIYDGNSPQTFGGAISGPIWFTVKSGTLTLSGASTFTGGITNQGGEVIANRAENPGVSGPLGENNTISFTGGTLGWSVNNIFDYSSRFDTAAGQAYKLDSGGQNVTLATGLGGGATLTKSGNGTITLSGTSSYSGLTTVSVGKLVFQGSKTGSGNITVADGAALGVTTTGTQVTPNTLTIVGTGAGAALEFNSVSSTVTAPLAPGTLSSSGAVTINVNSGTLAVGSEYPLLTWTTGSAPTASLGVLNGFTGYLTNDPAKTVSVVITGTAYVWTGLHNGSWDLSTANNWTHNSGAAIFANGAPTLFDDTAAGALNVTITGSVLPSALAFNNSTNAYSITSSSGNAIGGSTGLTKGGTNTLSLSGGANAYTGVTILNNGTVTVSALANGGSASDIGAATSAATNLVFNGGTLQYTNGTVSIDRLFQLATSGGTINASGSGALSLTNTGAIAYVGGGLRTLILTGTTATNNTLAAVLADNGGATSLIKNGAGEWDLTGNNTYSGLTTINNGTLHIGNGGASGSPGSGNIVDNGSLIFNRNTGNVTVNGAISGSGPVIQQGSNTVILAANNSYTGGTSISNGATLQIGNGGGTGSLASAPIIDNGTLIFNSTGTFVISGFANNITGTGNVIKRGSGTQKNYGANTYSGWTTIDAGATLQISQGNEGYYASSVTTNNGTLLMLRQDNGVFIVTNAIVGTGNVIKDVNNANPGDITLWGVNTYTGGTIIRGGAIILGDGITPGLGSIVGDVTFTNSPQGNEDYRQLEFNRPDSFTFPGNIVGPGGASGAFNGGNVLQNGTNVLTLTGNNTYVGGTTVSNGVVQVGNGGTIGSIGTGTASVTTTLVFNRSDSLTFSGGINGTGTVAQAGSGILTLSGALTGLWNTNDTADLFVAGTLAASNGTVAVTAGSVGGNVNVSGGLLSPSAIGTIGSMALTNAVTNTTMNVSSGGVLITVNKSLTPSNSVILAATGNVVATGGTVRLASYGAALAPGDKFVIFRQLDGVTPLPVSGGATMTVAAPGVSSFVNNLAVDGSVTVSTVTATPVAITATVSGGNLNLSWPVAWTGLHVQAQTNTLAKGLGTNWVTIPGSDVSNSYVIPLNKANPDVFYRLAP
jgi:fibronectin-binding autotransporter adhesin